MNDWITVKIADKQFYLTPHFIKRYEEHGLDLANLKDILLNSTVLKRPNYFESLIRHHSKEAQYLLYKGLLIVLERHYQTGEFRILRTAYDAKDKEWVNNYLSSTPKRKRKMFKEIL